MSCVLRGIKKREVDEIYLGRLMTDTINGSEMNVGILYCNVYCAT